MAVKLYCESAYDLILMRIKIPNLHRKKIDPDPDYEDLMIRRIFELFSFFKTDLSLSSNLKTIQK